MELWIRGQDKEILTKYDCLSLKKYGVFPNYIIVAHIGNNIIDLGIYKSKERALEVLDEIQKYLTPTIQMLDETIGNKQVCQIGTIMTIVYKMPKE